jgi:hypothetical protein
MKIETKFNFGDKFYYVGKYIDPNKSNFVKIVIGSTIVNDIIINNDLEQPFYYKFFIEDYVTEVFESTITEGIFTLLSLPGNEKFNFCFADDQQKAVGVVIELLKQVEKEENK